MEQIHDWGLGNVRPDPTSRQTSCQPRMDKKSTHTIQGPQMDPTVDLAGGILLDHVEGLERLELLKQLVELLRGCLRGEHDVRPALPPNDQEHFAPAEASL